MKSFIHSNKCIYAILTLIILIGITYFSYTFFFEKQGTHSDEEWSFGLANSYYEPYIYSSDDDHYSKNNNQWISGETLKNYLTVQKGERFSFGSVYYNMACDTHPPLYFFILHFLSSFFVNQYLPILGLIINLICYIVISIYLYRLLILVSKSHYLGIIGVIFNTFTSGTLSMIIYIRMYAMVAMFALLLAYYIATIFYIKYEEIKTSTFLKIAIITLLGSLTHHFFLPYTFAIVFILFFYWLLKKEYSILIKFTSYIILGISLSIIIFPATLDHLFGIQTFNYIDTEKYTNMSEMESDEVSISDNISNTESNGFNTNDIENYNIKIFRYYFLTCFSYIFSDIIGFSPISPYKKGYTTYFLLGLISFLLIILVTTFLFRNESWFINYRYKIRENLNNLRKKKHLLPNVFIFSLLFAILFIVLVCCKTVNIIVMGRFTNRYLFLLYPIVTFIILYCIFCIFKKISIKKQVLYRILFSAFIVLHLHIQTTIYQNNIYLFKDSKNISLLKEKCENANIIIIASSKWHLTVYAPIIYNCNSFYFTTYSNFFNNKISIPVSNSNLKKFLILDTSLLINDTNNNISASTITYSANQLDISKLLTAQNRNYVSAYKTTYINYLSEYLPMYSITHIENAEDFGITIEFYELNEYY